MSLLKSLRAPLAAALLAIAAFTTTAPTPARTCAQRAATEDEDELTALPNMPVCAQRAEMEKVMPYASQVMPDRG